MKKLLLVLFILLPLIASAQSGLSAVTLKNGTVLKGIIKQIDSTDAITIDIAGIETKIKMNDVQQIEPIDITVPNTHGNKSVEIQKVAVSDPLKDYKGFLLAKGNSVYIYSANSDEDPLAKYNTAGANAIKALLKADGFWNVVDHIQQAHFTINYIVDTSRSDYAYLSVSSWRTGKSIIIDKSGTNESIDKNRELAKKFYRKGIVPLQRKIEKGNISKNIITDFTIK